MKRFAGIGACAAVALGALLLIGAPAASGNDGVAAAADQIPETSQLQLAEHGWCRCKSNCRRGISWGGSFGTGARCLAECERVHAGCRRGGRHT